MVFLRGVSLFFSHFFPVALLLFRTSFLPLIRRQWRNIVSLCNVTRYVAPYSNYM